MNKFQSVGVLAAACVAAGLSLSACSSDDASEAVSNATSSAESAVSEATSPDTTTAEAGESGTAGAGGDSTVTGPDGPIEVDPAIGAKYAEAGGATGALGDATGPQETIGDGFAVPFEGGTIYSSPETGAHVVQGEILRVYTEQGGPTGAYLFPLEDETTVAGGWSSTFSGGTITWTETTPGEFAETLTPN